MRDLCVLYVDTFKGEGSDNSRGRCAAYKRAMCEVATFDYRYSRKEGMNQALISKARRVRPNLIQLGKCELVLGSTIYEIKKSLPDCKVIHFYGDYRNRVQSWVADIGQYADVTLLYHKDPDIIRAHERVCNRVGYWWVGTDPEIFKPMLVEKKYDVVFMGNCGEGQARGQGPRREFVKYLRDRGIELVIHGRGSRPFVQGTQFAEVVSKARIALGFGTIEILWYTSWRRVFNCMASGTFYLSRYFPGLEEVFERGVHLDWFENEVEAVEKIEYYLSHEEERERIAIQGMEKVISEHTWDHRIEELLQWLD